MRRWRLAALLAASGMLLAACPNGAGTPVSGPANATCKSGIPPINNLSVPADTCGVQPLTLTKSLPQAKLDFIQVDLYIQDDITCATSFISTGCGVDDNRNYVVQGSPDPGADPSRNRIHTVLDFNHGTMMFRISPSCRIHPANAGPLPLGWNGDKECFAPKQTNEGTSINITTNTGNPHAWTIEITSVAVQTNYPAVAGPIEIGQVQNDWNFTIDPTTGAYTMTGNGTNFPDLAVISNGKVECSDQATHISGMVAGLDKRSYNCAGTAKALGQASASPSPTPTPSQARLATACTSANLLTTMRIHGANTVKPSGAPICVGDYAMQDFSYPPGPTSNYPTFFFQRTKTGWEVLGGGAIGDTVSICNSLPAAARQAFTRPPTADSGCPGTAPSPSQSLSGPNSPQGVVQAFYAAERVGNWNQVCTLLQPSIQATCLGIEGSNTTTATGNFTVNGSQIHGSQALVEVTGSLTFPDEGSYSNSDPASGMPPAAGTFAQVFANLTNGSTTVLSPVPCVNVSDTWYVDLSF